MNSRLHFAIAPLAASVLVAALTSSAPAATGVINLTVSKGGVIIGGSSGTGTLQLNRRTYPLVIGGASAGFTLGGSRATLTGRVTNIRRPADIEGRYSAATGGVTIGQQGRQRITLSNEKGAVLQLTGTLTGLMVNADVGGMRIQLRK